MNIKNSKIKHLAIWLMFWSAASHADLMLSGNSTASAFNMPLSSQEQIWIGTAQVRRDFTDRGRAYTHLFDLGKKQVVMIDHFTRVAEITSLTALDAATQASAPSDDLKLKLEPTGNISMLQNWTCKEHDFAASVPTVLGNEQTVFNLKGKIWIASGVPEQAEVKALVNAAKKPDFFITIPQLAQVAPAYSRIMNEILRKVVPIGLPCAGEMQASYEGSGPMANLARKLPSKASLRFQQYASEPIKPEMFAIPAGYRLMQKSLPATGMPRQ